MKRWLKKYGRWIVVGLGVLFIANGVYGMFNMANVWMIPFHTLVITLWLIIIIWVSGALEKLYNWWR